MKEGKQPNKRLQPNWPSAVSLRSFPFEDGWGKMRLSVAQPAPGPTQPALAEHVAI
jgi:hypothetical protein